MRRFPAGAFGRQRLTFHPAPARAPLRAFACVVIPWLERRVVLADIVDRGWCVPSGRVEPGETSEAAARREAKEEAGLELGPLTYLGCYRMSDRLDVRWIDCFTAEATELGEIGLPEESRGRRRAGLDELPDLYHEWDPLMEAVFRHAEARMFRRGGPT